MAKVGTINPVDYIKGKLGGTDSGYFYVRNGKQFYRARGKLSAEPIAPSEMEFGSFRFCTQTTPCN